MATKQAADKAIAEVKAATRHKAPRPPQQGGWASAMWSPFRMVGGVVGLAYSAMSSQLVVPAIGTVTGWLAKISWMPQKVSGVLDKATALAGTPNVQTSELSRHIADLAGPQTRIASMADRAHTITAFHANRILSGYRGQQVLERAGQLPLAINLITAASIGGGSASLIGSFAADINELRRMQKDLTGKPVSVWSVLYGSHLHPEVKAARRDVIGVRALVSDALRTAGMAGLFYMTYLGRNPLETEKLATLKHAAKTLAVMGGADMAANMVSSSLTALSASRQLRLYFDKYGQAPAEVYEALIGGFAPAASAQLVQKFAQQCADEKLPPQETLQRIVEFKHALTSQRPQSQSAAVTALGKPVVIGSKTFVPRGSYPTMAQHLTSSPVQAAAR